MPERIQIATRAARASRDAEPGAAEWGKIRTLLAKAGIKNAEVRAVLGDDVNGRKRKEVADELRAWLKTRPKA